jgi:hypothetical protein
MIENFNSMYSGLSRTHLTSARLRRSCIFPSLLTPHKYAVLKRNYRAGVCAESFIWTISAVNCKLILAVFHRRHRRGVSRTGRRRSHSLQACRHCHRVHGSLSYPGHPHERLRRKQVNLHELFWPRPKHLLSQGHDDGDRLRRSNRNSDLKQSLVISVPVR